MFYVTDPKLDDEDGTTTTTMATTNDSFQSSSSMCVMFEDEQRAFSCIQELKTVRQERSAYQLNDRALQELRSIYDKYLELPSLLDRSIVTMVEQMTQAARPMLSHISNDIVRGKDDEISNDIDLKALHSDFIESPLPRILSAIYALSKVRGRKRVQKFLTHQVDDVEPVLDTLWGLDQLRRQVHVNGDKTDISQGKTLDGGPQLWESMYTLWNWMGIIAKIPFDCDVVMDTHQVSRLLHLSIHNLSETGPIREVASSCLACWLTRPDLEKTEFQRSFHSWSTKVLNGFVDGNSGTTDSESGRSNIFAILGILQTLVAVLKVSTANRKVLLQSMEQYLQTLLKLSASKPSNLLLRKFLAKFWTRIGVLYLPPKIASWRYQRGRRLLLDNLKQRLPQHDDANANLADLAIDATNHDDYFSLVLDEVEVALGKILRSLTDGSTMVRWSSAKGIGRITCRLPAICAEDVLDAILGLFDNKQRDNDWHGACLALAEMARKGLLMPHRLKDVVAKVVEAIHYDVPRHQTSVGAHVRDAACYTYWALARAYAPETLKAFVPQLGESIVVSFLFDREINCRRAASAAFQEMVGRQGAQNFKNGILILTAADFFTLGNRKDAYINISLHVAQFDEYRKAIIDHLFQVKLNHWDPAIRHLSSQSLNQLVQKDPGYMAGTVLPFLLDSCVDPNNLALRHGATLGIAEIVLAFKDIKSSEIYLSRDMLTSVAEIVPNIEKKRLYRGKGGEQMRAAVCRLIECISIAQISLTVPQQVRLLDTIDACLSHPSESTQEQAGRALYALMRSYFPVGPNGPSSRLQNRVVDKYANMVRTSSNPAATRGFALGLGCLPAKLLAPSSSVIDVSLDCLCRASRPDARVGTDKDAETRRNALVALTRICETISLYEPNGNAGCVVGLTERQVNHVFDSLFCAMDDYNRDQRGDVGSKCRVVAMEGLLRLSKTLSHPSKVTAASETLSRDRCLSMIGLILKQFSEKLDAVRSEAARLLFECLDENCLIKAFIPKRENLISVLTQHNIADPLKCNWADASSTFPMVMKIADEVEDYFDFIISGMIVSVGCLTQSTSQNASKALIQWCRNTNDEKMNYFGSVLLGLLGKHKGDGRVILPLLKTMDTLMNRMCMDRLIKDKKYTSSLISNLREERKGCADVPRLHAILNVGTGLILSLKDSPEATGFVCEFLTHEYPRIRSLAAEKLYVRLQETDPDLDEQHNAIRLLLYHSWEVEDCTGSQGHSGMALQVSQELKSIIFCSRQDKRNEQ